MSLNGCYHEASQRGYSGSSSRGGDRWNGLVMEETCQGKIISVKGVISEGRKKDVKRETWGGGREGKQERREERDRGERLHIEHIERGREREGEIIKTMRLWKNNEYNEVLASMQDPKTVVAPALLHTVVALSISHTRTKRASLLLGPPTHTLGLHVAIMLPTQA